MSVKKELEASSLKLVGRGQLLALATEALCAEHPVMLICNLGAAGDAETRRKHVAALEKAGVLSGENVQQAMADDTQLVALPFWTLTVAEDVYRHIAHASHFVTIWVDGEPYPAGC